LWVALVAGRCNGKAALTTDGIRIWWAVVAVAGLRWVRIAIVEVIIVSKLFNKIETWLYCVRVIKDSKLLNCLRHRLGLGWAVGLGILINSHD
jgi:hypothetical protein